MMPLVRRDASPRHRLQSDRLRVLVVGEAKRGKTNGREARADLQYRMAEATRTLSRAMRLRYAEGTGWPQIALETAAQLRQATGGGVAQRDRQLADWEGCAARPGRQPGAR